ncbi:hypothetical protein V7128_01530 [Neobacillus vireti]|uniref:hypothetical protein n=1 Tax=Neobacillus vireti TaxID=220686 RepID=UPI002FFD794B
MDSLELLEGEVVYLNEHAQKFLPNRIGEIAIVDKSLYDSKNFDYRVQFEDSECANVKDYELTTLTKAQKELIKYIYKGNEVLYSPTNQNVIINKVDLVHYKVGINFVEGDSSVVDIDKIKPLEEDEQTQEEGYFESLALEVGKLVDQKQKAYGDSVTKCYEIMKVLLQDYSNNDGTYTIPESLIPIMLLEVRKIDKTNRRFSNPDGDLMSENPYQDDVGYSLLGVRLMEQLHNDK